MPPSFFDIGQRVLLRRVKSNAKDLTEIDLVDANIGPKATCKLLDALHENNVVKTLWLSGNAMGDRGAVALADLLKANCNICQVIFGLNEIGATGAVAISGALMKDGAALDVLCMGGNFGVGDLGASAIGEALGMDSSRRQIGPFEILPAETKPGRHTGINRIEDILGKQIKHHTRLILLDLASGGWVVERNNMLGNGGIDSIRFDRFELGHRAR